MGVSATLRRCVKASNDARPRYEPEPDRPTPPNGTDADDAWKKLSLMVAPPERTESRTRRCAVSGREEERWCG